MPLNSSQIGAISGGVSAGSQLMGGIIGSIMQKRENARQRDYELQMYNRQKADNIKFWEMENQYNTPVNQMQRLKDAGLNPNLMYGSPQSGGNAGSISSPTQGVSNSTKTVNPLQGFDASAVLTNMYDFRIKEAQLNLLNQQTKTQATQAGLNAINQGLASAKTNTERTLLTAQRDKLLADIANVQQSTRTSQASEYATRTNTDLAIQRNVRDWENHRLGLKETMSRILNIQTNTKERQANINLTHAQTANTITNTDKQRIEAAILEFERVANSYGYKMSDGIITQIGKGFIHTATDMANNGVDFLLNQIKKATKSLKK